MPRPWNPIRVLPPSRLSASYLHGTPAHRGRPLGPAHAAARSAPRGPWRGAGGIYMKLSVDSLHQCEGFVLFCQTFSEDLSRGVSFS